MAAIVLDRACMTVAVGGTGAITLGSAVPRFRTFAAAGAGNGDNVAYVIEDGSNWEIGDGTYSTAGPTLTRTTLINSSTGSALNVSTSAIVYSSPKNTDLVSTAVQALGSYTKAQVRANIDAAWAEVLGAANLAANGFHQISQANGLSAVSIASGNAAYISDQWVMETVGPAISGQVVADPFTSVSIKFGQKLLVTTAKASLSASDYVTEYVRLEGNRVANLGYGTAGAEHIFLCRIMKSNIAMTGYIWMRNAAKDRTYLRSFTLAANTEKAIVTTLIGDTSGTWNKDSLLGMEIGFSYAVGSSMRGTVNTWNAGTYYGTSSSTNLAATQNNYVVGSGLLLLPYSTTVLTEAPLIYDLARFARAYDVDLRECQRYYEKCGIGAAGAWSDANTAQLGVGFKVPKRQVSGMALSLSQNNPSILEPGVSTRTGSSSALSVANGPTVNGAIVSINGFTGATAGKPALLTDDVIIVDNRL